jgi:hypothetical protein
MIRIALLVLALCLFCKILVSAQSVYFVNYTPQYGMWIWRIDTATCQSCPVYEIQFTGLPFAPVETLILPNGKVLMGNYFGSPVLFDPITNTTTSLNIPYNLRGALVMPDGTIYVTLYTTTMSYLATFNQTTNEFTIIGELPIGFMDEFFYANGQLYGIRYPDVYQIDLTNPSASFIVQNVSPYFGSAATSTPNGTVYTAEYGSLDKYNVTTNTFTNVCMDLPPYFTSPYNIDALTVLPPGVPEPPCACITKAGNPLSPAYLGCAPNSINAAFSAPSTDPNDVVRYILYDDVKNPLGSILFTQTSSVFPFVPPLVTGKTYYIRQVVANGLNGSFDPNDPCLKLSPPAQVLWREKPTLVSLAANTDICTNSCTDATIVLNGSPSFTFTWQLRQNGTTIASGTETTPNASSTFQVCLPANATAGSNTQLVVCTITDAFCTNF